MPLSPHPGKHGVNDMDTTTMTARESVETTKQWRFYSYDVWGNAKDGYEVNNVFRTADVISIPDSVKTDAQLFAHLKRIGFIDKPYLRTNKFETDHNIMADDVIYFSYNGKPEGEFRLERPE
jgi:hypothetical protein